MDPKLAKKMEKMGGGDIMSGTDVDAKDIEAVLKEVYGGLGKEVPPAGQASNPLAGIDLTPKKAAAAPVPGPIEVEETSQERLERIAESKEQFVEGQGLAKKAVLLDTNEKYGMAAVHYDKALACFARALSLGFPKKEEYRKSLVERMTKYMDRLQELCIGSGDKSLKLQASTSTICSVTELNHERRMVFKALAKEGYRLLTRALGLKKRAKKAESEGELFEAFVLYRECLDCLLAYKDTSEKVQVDEGTKATVTKLIMEALDRAEAVKKEL